MSPKQACTISLWLWALLYDDDRTRDKCKAQVLEQVREDYALQSKCGWLCNIFAQKLLNYYVLSADYAPKYFMCGPGIKQ